MNKSWQERFWQNVDKSGDCWVWTGFCGTGGYGQLVVNNRHMYAHRLAMELAGIDVPGGLCALHACDNPPCVNPDHLFIGTQADNNRDRVQKGRGIVGEKHPRTTLTNEQATNILNNYSGVRGEQADLARQYGVTHTVIHNIISRKFWKHLTMDNGSVLS